MASLKYGGAENSTFTNQFLTEYSVNAGFTPDITLYANTTELFQALRSGAVDAVVTNIMFADDDLKLLGRFSPMPVYYITSRAGSELLAELDDAMTTLRLNDPSFETELMSHYFPVFNNVQLSYAEHRFIKDVPAITIGYQVNHAPLSYTDKDGAFAGITRDILDRIAELTGFTFHYVPLPATNVTYDYLREHDIYIISNEEYNNINTGKKLMQLSTPYLESEKVLVAKSQLTFNSDTSLTVALATGSGTLSSVIAQQYPNFTTVAYATVDECFNAVHNGEADALMENRYVVESMLNKPMYSDMSVIPIQTLSDKMCLSTVQYENDDSALAAALSGGAFLSIVDKAINQLTTNDINSIIIRNTSANRYRMTLGDFLYQYRYTMAMTGTLVLVSICLLVYARQTESEKNRLLAQKNQQLTEAVAQAERADRAKSQFLSRMSHEIRTPMNAIVGLTAIAKKHREDPDRVDDYLSKIDASSRVLLNIINDVLDMSAIESEKLKISHEEFDLKTVLTGISGIYFAQCRQKGVLFELVTDVSDEVLIGDALRLNQILLNLVSNAYKFTPSGGSVRVTVQETEKRDQQVFLRFTVSDTGCGMSPDMLTRLFKPFEQESAATAQKHGGSGLGLSIAKNLVSMMHGAIQADSEQGRGTTFTVDIPFDTAGHTADVSPEKLRHIRALVVDDDSDAREYTSVILQRIGVQFDMADCGDAALTMLRQARESGRSYDICFIDWKLPGLTGVELTQKIREQFDGGDTVIIIVSAYDLSEVEGEAKAAGANLFILKPLFQSTVFNLLMQLSGGSYTKQTADSGDYDFGGRRVLLAEDNDLNAEIAAELLGMVNVQVDRAENGEQAVALFTASQPGVYSAILMDVQMPVMDGHTAARLIRDSDHPQAAEIPMFAMTANAFTEDVSAALSAGMNGHIAKPIETAVLYNTLRDAWKL